jgi:S-adenosylmethionine hydrolase
MTGIKAEVVDRNAVIVVNEQNLSFAETFSSVQQSALFWYQNSLGLVEISCNSGSAASVLGLSIGSRVVVRERTKLSV